MIITRGTAPTISVTLPFNADEMVDYYITFSQMGGVIFEKTEEDCTMSAKILAVSVSQKDTLKLTDNKPLEIQIRCKNAQGKPYVSKIQDADVGRILKEGVI